MMEAILTGLVAVGVPLWLAIEEMLHRRQQRRRAVVEGRPADAVPDSRRAAVVAVGAPSRRPAGQLA
jgi:hypothetical protein